VSKTPGISWPTKERVVEVLSRSSKPVEKRRISKILGLKGPARDALKLLLREMLRNGELTPFDEGKVGLPRKDGVPVGAQMVEIVEADVEEGILRARPLEWTDEEPAPLARVRLPEGQPIPPIGAHALAKVKRDPNGEGWLADILRVADRTAERLVARLDRVGANWRLIPTDRKMRVEFGLAAEPPDDIKAGDLVLAEVLPARRLGSPQDVAGPVVFLCSDRANYITGIELPVNGGQLFYP
jgi:ribonuclease R